MRNLGKPLAAAAAAALCLAPSISAATPNGFFTIPLISSVDAVPTGPNSSAITVNFGSFTTELADTDYQVCTVYISSSSGPASGPQAGPDGLPPGGTGYAQASVQPTPAGGPCNHFTNVVSFTVPAYVVSFAPTPAPPPAQPAPTTTTAATTTATATPTTTTAAASPAPAAPSAPAPSGGASAPAAAPAPAPAEAPAPAPASASLPAPPTADFSGAIGAAPGQVAYSSGAAQGTNPVVSTVWNFGDGASGIGPGVSHAYAYAGQYVVTLTVVDSAGLTAQAARVVTVTPARTGVILGGRVPVGTQLPHAAAQPLAAKKAKAKAKAKHKPKPKAKR